MKNKTEDNLGLVYQRCVESMEKRKRKTQSIPFKKSLCFASAIEYEERGYWR